MLHQRNDIHYLYVLIALQFMASKTTQAFSCIRNMLYHCSDFSPSNVKPYKVKYGVFTFLLYTIFPQQNRSYLHYHPPQNFGFFFFFLYSSFTQYNVCLTVHSATFKNSSYAPMALPQQNMVVSNGDHLVSYLNLPEGR